MKKLFPLIASLFMIASLTSCNKEEPHVHTFSSEWHYDESSHWKIATCEHTDLTYQRGSHIDLNEDGACDTCGYVKPLPTQYIVSFVTNSESVISPIFVEAGNAFVKPDDPQKDNCVFLGWYDNEECSGNPYVFGSRVNSDIRLYALWGARVTFKNFDGTTFKESNVRLNQTVSVPQNPTYEDAYFMGWYDNQEYNGTAFDFTTPLQENLTLYPSFAFKVEFLGADKSLYKEEMILVGKRVAKPLDPQKDYYDFEKWYLDEQLTTEYEFSNSVNSNLTLYSNFTPKTYNIVYHNVEGVTHLNPNTYTYGMGLEQFVSPSSAGENQKFYGWYLDEDFTREATSIGSDVHGTVDIYCKKATVYNIVYNNWPTGFENPNPTTFTKYDTILLDLSSLTDDPGIISASYTIDGNTVPGIPVDREEDVTVDITYECKVTNVTLDPNYGELLPNNTFIYVDFRLGGSKIKLDVPSSYSGDSLNLFDAANLEIPTNPGHTLIGFSSSPLSYLPLSVSEVNNLPNGSTVYAVWGDNGDVNLLTVPYSTEGNIGQEEKVYSLYVPLNISKVNFSFIGNNFASANIKIYEPDDEANPLYSIDINKALFETTGVIIDVKDINKINIKLTVTPLEEQTVFYFLALQAEEYSSCFVNAYESGDSIVVPFTYLDTPNMNNPFRDDHTFIGWFDEDGNQYDLSDIWTYTGDSITLIAVYKYNNIEQFIMRFEDKFRDYVSKLSLLTYLSGDQASTYNAQLQAVHLRGLSSLDGNYDYETAFAKCLDAEDELARVYYAAEEDNFVEAIHTIETSLENKVESYFHLLLENKQFLNAASEVLERAFREIENATSINQIENIYNGALLELDSLYETFSS